MHSQGVKYKGEKFATVFSNLWENCIKTSHLIHFCFCFLQAETIMRISDYVKSHPRASEAQLKTEVEKEIKMFAQKIAELEAMP